MSMTISLQLFFRHLLSTTMSLLSIMGHEIQTPLHGGAHRGGPVHWILRMRSRICDQLCKSGVQMVQPIRLWDGNPGPTHEEQGWKCTSHPRQCAGYVCKLMTGYAGSRGNMSMRACKLLDRFVVQASPTIRCGTHSVDVIN